MPIAVHEPSEPVTRLRAATGSIAGTGQADITVTWPSPFPDTNYTVVVAVEIDEAGDSLWVRRIRSKTTAGCVVNVANAALMTKTGTLHVMAMVG